MKILYNSLYISLALLLFISSTYAGNPDRQGEAGAYELLMVPWARSAGLSAMTTSNVTGVEAFRINVAGISRVNNLEITVGHADYLSGTNTKLNSLGLVKSVGKNNSSALGFSLMTVGFGDIPETTEAQPDGTGAVYSPSFFNLGIGYAHMFENKISVGFVLRVVSEATSDISGMGLAIDAGVQYVTGERDNFKFGISLRNIGTKMKFSGQGIKVVVDPDGDAPTQQQVYVRDAAAFELPSMLGIGVSNDFYITPSNRLTLLGQFTANSFSRDQIGGGLEYAFKERFMIRAGYKAEIGTEEGVQINNVYSGLSAGATLALPISKSNDMTILQLHYAYRHTEVFDGTHNFGVTLSL